MKKMICFAFVLWVNVAKAQSLLLSPDDTPPAQLRHPVNGYKHSNLTNSSILNFSVIDGVPTIQTLTNSSLSFTVGDGSGLMWLSQQGYLSIGGSLGTERLDIKKGRIRFTGQKAAGQPSGYVFTDMNGTSVFRLEMKDDNHLGIVEANVPDSFVMNVNTGNVGINIAPSAEALTVSGSVHTTQFESAEEESSPLLATTNGDLVKGTMNKIEITPWDYTRFGSFGNNNYTIGSGLGYYKSNGEHVELSAPVHLPDGVIIKNIKANVIDNSSSYITIEFLGLSNDGTTTLIRTINSKYTPESNVLTEIGGSMNTLTDCAGNYYIISVTVQKFSDNTSSFWPGSELKLGAITITYTY